MGVEYGLYHRESKRFIWLGKIVVETRGFQRKADEIAAFIASVATGEFAMHSDAGEPPHWSDGQWREAFSQSFPGTHCEHAVYNGGREAFVCGCGWSTLGGNFPDKFKGAETRNGLTFIPCPECSK